MEPIRTIAAPTLSSSGLRGIGPASAVQESQDAGTSAGSFATALANALESVNQQQQAADSLGREVQMGNSSVTLEETMIAMAKANIGFQAAVQTRNRLVAAYQDIMNMQV